jgi:putative hydrolase of the HAD superfamily
MVIIFDLDDTLYEEQTFVLSGFRVVSQFLAPILQVTDLAIYHSLIEAFHIKREKVFDRVLDIYQAKTKKLISNCLAVYRSHSPNIHLFPGVKECLESLQSFPIYIITDGNKLVQKRKFMALGLEKYVKKCLCTYAYGLQHSKPSPYCFEKICHWERVQPHQVVYIADNPKKDFVGIKPLGFQTIRILTGAYKELKMDEQHEAAMTVRNINELNKILR